ncbi:hypothetical protein [Dysgonomonas sp. ZJ279]|uniref:hypothetical protein n=1 Tax=Dysgonomonas sp. ZJ279 TaxID=2709796 RepID=UPI0013EE0DEF|nr:hypothetical protein [Dysgonomonas sp. ZJ279]
MAEKNISNPSEAQINKWKKEHNEVHVLKVGGKIGYLHNPDRATLSLAMMRIAKNDILGGCTAILENCWLGGDEEIKTNDKLFMGAVGVVGELITAETATLEKL